MYGDILISVSRYYNHLIFDFNVFIAFKNGGGKNV
jgi:hypothetical protein